MTLKMRKAEFVDRTFDGMEVHSFSTAIIQKNTPGIYTYEFGKGRMDVEAVVNYMLIGTETLTDIAARTTAFGNYLTNHSLTQRLFAAFFPALTQKLDKKTIMMTINDENEAIERVLGKDASPGDVAALAEICTEVFADSNFIAPSIGFSFREKRVNRMPDLTALIREFVRVELISIIQSVPLRIRIAGTKFNLQYLQTEFQSVLSKLGKAMNAFGYHYQYFVDAAYVVHKYFTKRGSFTDFIPKEVENSTELGDLLANVTFVQAAFEASYSEPASGAWALMNSIKQTNRILNLSERYQVVTLETAIAPYRYETITDARSNLVGGVLSYAVSFKHPIDAGIFGTATSLTDAAEATPLPDCNDALNTLVNPLQGQDIMLPAHNAVVQMLSAKTISELEDDPRSTLAIIDVLTDVDLFHIAAAKADAIFMNPKVAQESTLVFQKDLRGRRLFAESLPFEGTVYTSDPSTLILSCSDWDYTIPFDMATQVTPSKVWETFMLDDTGDLLHDFGQERRFSVEVAGKELELNIDLTNLLHLVKRPNVKMLKHLFTPQIFESALTAPIDAYEYVVADIKTEEAGVVRTTLETQLGHILNGILSTIYNSDAIRAIADDVIRRLVRKMPARQKDLTYQTLHQIHYRRNIDIGLSFMICKSLGLLSCKEERSAVEERILKFFKETHFYARLIGTELGRAKREK